MNTNATSHGLAEKLLTYRELEAIIGGSRTTVWRRIADGTLPKPIKIGSFSRFVHSEVMACIEQAKAQRAA